MVFNVCDSWLYARHELILMGASPSQALIAGIV